MGVDNLKRVISSYAPDKGLEVDNGIKDESRIDQLGEVYTPENIVNQMLDMCQDNFKSERDVLDKTYLEPSCGNGNFLVKIIERKLKVADKGENLKKVKLDVFRAYATTYGVDIMPDNVEESKQRMLQMLEENESLLSKLSSLEDTEQEKFIKAIWRVLEHNIVTGNTITGKLVSDGIEAEELTFIDWSISDDGMVSGDEKALTEDIGLQVYDSVYFMDLGDEDKSYKEFDEYSDF